MLEKQVSAAAERRALVAQYYVSGGDPGQRMQFAVDFAQSGLKTLFLANGGALLALLTFFHPEKSGAPMNVGLLAIGMVGYAVGLACALIASIGAHVSQNLFFLTAVRAKAENRLDIAEARAVRMSGDSWQYLATGVAVLSIIAFVVATIFCASALANTG